MAAWPGSLPELEVGATETRQMGFIRTQTDTGPYKQRSRFTKAARFIKGTILLDATQRATFDTFYETTIVEGSGEFDWTDPADQSTVSFRFVTPPSFTYLVGGPSGVAQSRVQLDLEIV